MERLQGVITSLNPVDVAGFLGTVKTIGGVWNNNEFPIRTVNGDIVMAPGIEVSFLVACFRTDSGNIKVALDLKLTTPTPEIIQEPPLVKLKEITAGQKLKDEEVKKKTSFLLPILQSVEAEYKKVNGHKTSGGKGGPTHRYLQLYIQHVSGTLGWTSTIEKQIPGSTEATDVLLARNNLTVACEVAITGVYTEFLNIRKNVAAGYHYVVSISPTEAMNTASRRSANKKLSKEELSRAYFILPEELPQFLESKGAESMQSFDRHTVHRGFKVKTHIAPITPTELEAKEKSIARLLTQSSLELLRLKQ